MGIFVLCTTLLGCVTSRVPLFTDGCNLRAETNLQLQDYVSHRYGSDHPVRAAVIPFDVPESFALPGNDSEYFGRTLARKLVMELHRSAVLPIVELFNRDRWPGKREEYFTGNYRAIEQARNAGYDLVVLGYMENIQNDNSFTILTKVIDTSNQVTIWSASTEAYSLDRSWRRSLAWFPLYDDQPNKFQFPEKIDTFAQCTVSGILTAEEVPK